MSSIVNTTVPCPSRTGGWLENRFPSEVVRTIRRLKQEGVGRWNNISYADKEVNIRVPQLASLIPALLPMLPQLQSHSRVLDIQSISAQSVATIAAASGASNFTLLTNHLKSDFSGVPALQVVSLPAIADNKLLPDAGDNGYDLILSVLGLQEWLESCTSMDNSSFHRLLQSWFDRMFASLSNGGHLFIASSDDGRVSLFQQLQIASRAGLVDIDVVCKQEGFYIFGARKISGTQSIKSTPHESALPHMANGHSSNSQPNVSSVLSSTIPISSSELDSTPGTAEVIGQASAISPVDPASSVSSSSGFAREIPPNLLAKVPLLFRRFDPANSGRLAYSQLEALCRAVGRPIIDSEDDDESLWWVYQAVASEDRETGCTGISIEDLISHFYVTHLWDLQSDLNKLRIV